MTQESGKPPRQDTATAGRRGLDLHGIKPSFPVHWDPSPAELYAAAIARGEGEPTEDGAFSAKTAPHTGRSPSDRFIVRDAVTAGSVDWGAINAPLPPDAYRRLKEDVIAHLGGEELFVKNSRAGGEGAAGIRVRVVSTSAWHTLFAHYMLIRNEPSDTPAPKPDFTVLHAPGMQADPGRHATRSGAFVVLNLTDHVALIGGTRYAGEIKKSIFSVLNFRLPERDILPMHCSANVGTSGDSALFFGLSGTGKTTLSADPHRALIGDDEHGWDDDGIFNFEGGCYAKAIRLSAEAEPEIYGACRRFGTILENVVLDPETSAVDFDDSTITENTRASYPIDFIPNAIVPGERVTPAMWSSSAATPSGSSPPSPASPPPRRCTTSSPATRRRSRARNEASPSRRPSSRPVSARPSSRDIRPSMHGCSGSGSANTGAACG